MVLSDDDSEILRSEERKIAEALEKRKEKRLEERRLEERLLQELLQDLSFRCTQRANGSNSTLLFALMNLTEAVSNVRRWHMP